GKSGGGGRGEGRRSGPPGARRAVRRLPDRAEGFGQRLAMQDCQPRNGPCQRDIKPVQASGLRGSNRAWLDDDDMVEFQPFGQADWNDDKLVVTGVAV